MDDLKALLHSALLWSIFWTLALFAFLAFGARPVLRLIGLLFGLLGGVGLEGSDL